MNPSTLLGKVIEVPDKPIKRPKSAIEYDKQVNKYRLQKQLKELNENKMYRIKRRSKKK